MNVAAVAGHMCCVCAKARTKRKHHLVTLPNALRVSRCSRCACVACACVRRKATTRRDDKHAFKARAMPAVCVFCMSRPPRGIEQAHRATPPTMHPTWLCGHHSDAPTTCGGAARRRPFNRNIIHLRWAGSLAAPHPPRSGRHPSPCWACINHDRARPCCNKFGALTCDFFLTFQKKSSDLPYMMRCGI